MLKRIERLGYQKEHSFTSFKDTFSFIYGRSKFLIPNYLKWREVMES
jgi:hypothetical protein